MPKYRDVNMVIFKGVFFFFNNLLCGATSGPKGFITLENTIKERNKSKKIQFEIEILGFDGDFWSFRCFFSGSASHVFSFASFVEFPLFQVQTDLAWVAWLQTMAVCQQRRLSLNHVAFRKRRPYGR